MITTIVVIMRLRKLQLGCVAALVLMIAALSPDAHAQFLHPKIISKQVTVRNVVILPAKVEVVRDSMKGPEGMAAESEELSGRVEKMVTEVLANQKHIKTLSVPTSGGDTQGKYTVADIQAKFDDLLPKVMKKRK